MVLKEIRRCYSKMFEAEQKVADLIMAHPDQVVNMSMAELASRSGTSDATVLRMCRHIGQSGFYQLKINLAMELTDAGADEPSEPSRDDGEMRDVVDFVDETIKGLSEITKYISTEQIENLVEAIDGASSVYVFGWGSTYGIAFDLTHRLMRAGVRCHTSENVEHMMRMLVLGREGDLFVAVSHSGDSTYVIECMKLARTRGMGVALIENSPTGSANAHCDMALCTNVATDLLGGWGLTSHIAELLVCDLVLYFLKEKRDRFEVGTKGERMMAKFKL